MSTPFPGTPSMEGRSPMVNWVMMISAVALAVSLVVAFYYLLTQGHAAFNTHSYGITWGLGVSTYVYLVLVSTGLTFVASLAMMFRFDDFYPIAKRCVWLAIVTVVAGFVTLALEIGHPFPDAVGSAQRSPIHFAHVLDGRVLHAVPAITGVEISKGPCGRLDQPLEP